MISEDKLLKLASQGEQTAIAALLSLLKPDLIRLIKRMNLRKSERDDACQEAILKVIDVLPNYDPKQGTFKTYALSCVRNRLIHLYYRDKEEPTPLGDSVAMVPQKELEPNSDLHDALERAKPELRRLVQEHYGLVGPARNLVQLCEIHKLSRSAVKSRLEEAFRQMRGEV